MNVPPMSPRAQELARQVWRLPHVRLAVFEDLCALEGLSDERHYLWRRLYLKQFIFLDRETSLDVALLLYRVVVGDEFPGDCIDPDRLRAYKAGVHLRQVHVDVPFSQLDLAKALKTYPNLLQYSTPYFNLILERERKCTAGLDFDCLGDAVTIKLDEKGVAYIDDSRSSEHEQPALLELLNMIEVYERPSAIIQGSELRAKHFLGAPGEAFETPRAFLLPARHFRIHGLQWEWIALLAWRRAAGIPIESFSWKMYGINVEDGMLGQLARAMPPGVKVLTFRLFTYDPLSAALDAMMRSLDVRLCPELQHVTILIVFYQTVDKEHSNPDPPRFDWSDIVLPPRLQLNLLLEISDHISDERSDEEFVEEQLLAALPLSWLGRATRKLREVGGNLNMQIGRQEVDAPQAEDFLTPAVAAAVIQALGNGVESQ